MLLPSDVARLVLGYLQEEGLSATSQAFINESPNLKEYADHTTGDGTIPACVFSVFGKGLTTILNEYVAAKTKETSHEVPPMMTSLWKKLDFTLNQIKSLQNSPAISASQRTRSRVGMANMARQRILTVTSASAVVCSTVSEASSIMSQAQNSESMLGHSTPVSITRPLPCSGSHQQIQDVNQLVNTQRDSPIPIIVPENRINPGQMSPGRRKWDAPRRRSGAPNGSSGPARCAIASSSQDIESQPGEVVDENFPQLVIQNARDKILGDRSLQEKLAENINKILASDQTPQMSKPSTSTVEADQSIDEILGLQGELHMSDDAIHDILEQTESDPAFQALFDLFEYNKTKFPDGETEERHINSSLEVSDTAGPSTTTRSTQSEKTGIAQKEASNLNQTPMTMKTRTPDQKERKTRKPTAPTLLKKTVLGPSSRSSRIENSSARLLVSQGGHRGVSSAAGNLNRKVKASLASKTVFATPMEIDEPLNTPPDPSEIETVQEPAPKDIALTTASSSNLTTVPQLRTSTSFAVPDLTSFSDKEKKQELIQTQGSEEQSATSCALALSSPPVSTSLVRNEVNSPLTATHDLPHMFDSSSGGDTIPVSTPAIIESSSSTSAPACATDISVCSLSSSVSSLLMAKSGSPKPVTSSATTFTSSTSLSSPSSKVPISTPDLSNDSTITTSKGAADSSIVSLKIIISDNQDEHSSSDAVLSQAISGISGDKIPTIYLSSPAKSPAGSVTPKANLDEAALAVSGLQSSEGHSSPLSIKTGAVVSSPLTGTSQAQQNYIIQLPLDTANHALQGATTSYYIVTDPPTSDTPTKQVLLSASTSKGQPLPTNQYGVTTPTSSQGFSTGPAIILPSSVKPMMLPVSVVGQKTLGTVQVMSNQIVAIPSPVPLQQSQTIMPKHPTVAVKPSTTAGAEQHLVEKSGQPVSAVKKGLQSLSKAPKHRRILCFESSAEVQPKTATAAIPPDTVNISSSQPVQPMVEENSHSGSRTKPNILGGNKPKRRVYPIRCSSDSQTQESFVKEAQKVITPPLHQKDLAQKSNGQKDERPNYLSASNSRMDESKLEPLKSSDSGKKSQSVDRKRSRDKGAERVTPKDSHKSRSLSSDAAPISGTRKEKVDSSKKELEEISAKSCEGHTEKEASSEDGSRVIANKENEIKGRAQDQSAPSSASRETSSSALAQSASNPQSKATKAPSKTSSLAKQAAEMLQDIQEHNSTSTPARKPGVGTSDHTLSPIPGTSLNINEIADCVKTPPRQRKVKNREGTPKHLIPPNTPDVPTCSPASEAGSENSINMAAHTLMILSRAAIARTGTPLKDSLRQEGITEKSPTSSKNAKKRKPSSPASSPPTKKDRERKKLTDCFPHDLDVDKFLSSLHYDE